MALLGELHVLPGRAKQLVTLLGECKIQGGLLGCLLLDHHALDALSLDSKRNQSLQLL